MFVFIIQSLISLDRTTTSDQDIGPDQALPFFTVTLSTFFVSFYDTSNSRKVIVYLYSSAAPKPSHNAGP